MKIGDNAKRELRDAIQRYLVIRPELGHQFKNAIKVAFGEIASYPDRYPLILRTARQYLVVGFPYSVIYRYRTGTIRIISVHHHSRKPLGWRHR